jgi:membrane-bound lytic murein transglycosylase D
MVRYLLACAALAALIASVGCATAGAGAKVDSVPKTGDALDLVKQPKSPELLAGAGPAEILDHAQALFAKGAEETQAAHYDQALALNNQALQVLLLPIDREKTPDIAKKIDSLFFELCLAQLRIGRLTGRFAPVPIEKQLIGIDFHPEVEHWLGYFTLTGRVTMERYLARGAKYLPMIRAILREEGLPEDLAYLPIIESGFSPYAYSRAAAVGVWQFVAATGKNYGLTIDDWVDERRDPIKSTRAAAHYLKDLHAMFNDWALALAAYNCGENGVARVIAATGHSDYWRLPLPGETISYVPKFFAAAIIARDPEMYGIIVSPEPALDVTTVELNGVVDLRQFGDFIGVSYEDLKAINPELLGSTTPPNSIPYRLYVPGAKAEQIKKQLAAAQPEQIYLEDKQVAQLKRPAGGRNGGTIVYRVKHGDTLASIASHYNTSVHMIRRYNPKVSGKYLQAGMRLRIPVGKKGE